jgi:hypothetical protein
MLFCVIMPQCGSCADACCAMTPFAPLLQPPEVLKEGRMSPAMDIYGELHKTKSTNRVTSLHVFELGLQQHLHS